MVLLLCAGIERLFFPLGKRHISIFSTRNVNMDVGGLALVTFLGEKSWKISIV